MSLGNEFINQLRKLERDMSPDGNGEGGLIGKIFGPGNYVEQNNIYHQSNDPAAPYRDRTSSFSDDSVNYSDEDGFGTDMLSYTIEDTSTGERYPISIGYDDNFRIALVRGHDGSYYTKNTDKSITDYFRDNFDVSGKYRVYVNDWDKTPEETGYGQIWFDSNNGEKFIPSKAFSFFRPYEDTPYYGFAPKLTSPNNLPGIAGDYKK